MSVDRLLSGRTAIVTGGANGIGAAVTRALHAAGASVFVLDLDEQAGTALVSELVDAGGGGAALLTCDASEPLALEAAIGQVADRSSRIDCLVNNVGTHPPHRPIDDVDFEAFERLLRLNLTSYYVATRCALPHLRAAAGSIVNVGSLVSRIGQQHSAAYVASKGGVAALTRALAVDEAHNGVRVNAVLPGVVETSSHRAFIRSAAAAPLTDSWQWLGRVGQPEEVAHVCVFLASSLSSFVTGAEIVVSGGAELGYGVKATESPTRSP